MKLVDLADSKSAAERRAGSIPALGTTYSKPFLFKQERLFFLLCVIRWAPGICGTRKCLDKVVLTLPLKNVSLAEWFNSDKENAQLWDTHSRGKVKLLSRT